MLFTTMKDTPVGPLTLAAESGIITKLEFRALNDRDIGDTAPSQDDISVLERAVSELTLYFQGGLQEFTVPVRIDGPPFHKKVWHIFTRSRTGVRARRYRPVSDTERSPGSG